MSNISTKITKIGVFDSGAGGKSVADAIHRSLPHVGILLRDDKQHLPYGNKTPEQLLSFVVPILDELVKEGCEVIVIACNTVTTTIITSLRMHYTIPLIGIEPMVKSAAELTTSKVIAVCATPTTLASKRYHWLKNTYAQDLKVLEPDCSQWTRMIEADEVNERQIADQINEVCSQGADIIVLGCTHYHWIEKDIKRIAAGKAKVIQPEQAVVKQLTKVLAR